MGKGDQCTVCEGAVNIISIFDLYYEYMVINLKLTPGTLILQVQLCWGTPKALDKKLTGLVAGQWTGLTIQSCLLALQSMV